MLEIVKQGECSLIAGTITKTREGSYGGNKVITLTFSNGTESIDVEFWNGENYKRADMVKNVCINTFLSAYIKKNEKRNVGYLVKRQGCWTFPATLKEKPDSFDNSISQLIKDGIIENIEYKWDINSVKYLMQQTKNFAEDFYNSLKLCVQEEKNVVISTVTQIDTYDNGITKISVPVTEGNKTVYWKLAFNGKTAKNAEKLLAPVDGIKKRAFFVCGKKSLYNNIPNCWGFSFTII